jgi:hypothetical protein
MSVSATRYNLVKVEAYLITLYHWCLAQIQYSKIFSRLDVVVHTCNPSYAGGKDQED